MTSQTTSICILLGTVRTFKNIFVFMTQDMLSKNIFILEEAITSTTRKRFIFLFYEIYFLEWISTHFIQAIDASVS